MRSPFSIVSFDGFLDLAEALAFTDFLRSDIPFLGCAAVGLVTGVEGAEAISEAV